MSHTTIGIDAGGTLIKVAYRTEGSAIQYIRFPSAQAGEACAWIRSTFPEASICVTGGKTALIKSLLEHPELKTILEFDATCTGVIYLLERSGAVPDIFVLANAGTGTSIHAIHKDGHRRLGGTGVGGGTILGLSAMLTGISDYAEIIRLALIGDRDGIDLKVRHIYEGTEPPIPGDLTASNFGRVMPASASNHSVSNALASVLGLVGETVSTMSVLAAGQVGAAHIVYIGSSFTDNPLLVKIVSSYTILRGANPMVPEYGEYSGAIGALLAL